jgi:hypothetical protein
MALTEQQLAFYTEMDAMFDTPGWAHLVKGWTQEMESLPNSLFFNAKNVEDILSARIRYGLLHELVGLQATLTEQRRANEAGENE